MIRSFRCSDTQRLFFREPVRRFKAIERQALRKLDLLDAAPDMRTLGTLPGTGLEKLKGTASGNIASALTISGASVSSGATATPTQLRS